MKCDFDLTITVVAAVVSSRVFQWKELVPDTNRIRTSAAPRMLGGAAR